VNFANRTTCNTRKCGQPFPGLAAAGGYAAQPAFALSAPTAPVVGGYGAFARSSPTGYNAGYAAPYSLPAPVARHAVQKADAGENWICPACGNENRGHRDVCNTRKCRAPRPEAQCAQRQYAAPQNMAVMAAAPAAYGGGLNAGYAAFDGVHGAVEAGETWACPACGNENRGHRDVCNTRKCRAPRPEAQSAPRQFAAPQRKAVMAAAPVAYADEMNAGHADFGYAKGAGKGAGKSAGKSAGHSGGKGRCGGDDQDKWNCEACGNENFSFREECNTRKCRAPRPF